MNISENKRVLSLAAAFGIVFLALAYLGFSWRSAANEKINLLNERQSAFDEMRARDFPPTGKTFRLVSEAAKAADALSRQMLDSIEVYRRQTTPENGKFVSPQQFQAEVKAAILQLEAQSKTHSVGVSAGAARLGMANYQNSYATTEEAPILSFELKAVQNVAQSIIDGKAASINKIYCAPLPEEAIAPPGKRLGQEWVLLPFEINFTANKGTLPVVLNNLVENKQFCFLITGMRVSTETQLPALSPYVAPETPKAEATPSIGDDLGAGSSAPVADHRKEQAQTRVLAKQLLGNGTVRVHLALEVLYLHPVASDKK